MKGSLDWVSGRLYAWTLSYNGVGSATIEVRDAGTLVLTRIWASGMDTGNALQIQVSTNPSIGPGTTMAASVTSINGQALSGAVSQTGNNTQAEQNLYYFYPPMAAGFTATGTVNLTYASLPAGARVEFRVRAGSLPCTPGPAQAKLYFIHTDHLNTPRLISDDQQRTVWRWDNTDPFGGNPPDENPSGLGTFEFPLRFPGQYADKETNLAQNWMRDYWPEGGRYIQSDPIGLRGGLNTYNYVVSDPISSFDPNGLEVRLVCRPLAGAFGATGQQHCFVFVSCPAEGWSRILSLFATNASGTRGRKSLADPDTPTRRDDPGAPGNIGIPITPSKPGCDSCAYEKDVMNRFLAFPSGDVPYFMLGPNSNSFAQYLITSPTLGAGLPPSAPSNAPGFGFGWPGFGLPSR